MSEKSTVNTVIESISDNLLLILAAGLGIAGWMQTTGANPIPQVELPITGELLMTLALVVAVAGYWAGDKIDALLPDERGVILIAFQADEEAGQIWELTEDQFADMEIHGGSLHPWNEANGEVYEVRRYDPSRNVAVGNWRESVPGSELAAEATVEDVLAAVRELRYDLEPDAAEARELKRRIRGIIRTLDKERGEAQQAALDKHIAPAIGDSRSISEVLEDSLPDDLHPESMDGDLDETVARRGGGHPESGDTVSFDLLDDSEAMNPVAADGGKENE